MIMGIEHGKESDDDKENNDVMMMMLMMMTKIMMMYNDNQAKSVQNHLMLALLFQAPTLRQANALHNKYRHLLIKT